MPRNFDVRIVDFGTIIRIFNKKIRNITNLNARFETSTSFTLHSKIDRNSNLIFHGNWIYRKLSVGTSRQLPLTHVFKYLDEFTTEILIFYGNYGIFNLGIVKISRLF